MRGSALHLLHPWRAEELSGGGLKVAKAARALAGRCDVVVLAQASMEPAVGRLDGLETPVLTSPRSAVETVAAAVRSGGMDRHGRMRGVIIPTGSHFSAQVQY